MKEKKKKEISAELIRISPEDKAKITHVPVFVGMQGPVFPDTGIGMLVMDGDRDAAQRSMKKYDGYVVLTFRMHPDNMEGRKTSRSEFGRIATLGKILDTECDLEHGNFHVAVRTLCRVRLENLYNEKGCIECDFSYVEDILPANEHEKTELMLNASALFESIHAMADQKIGAFEDPRKKLEGVEGIPLNRLADFACTLFPAKAEEFQAVLETLNVRERLEKVNYLIQKFLRFHEMRSNMMERVSRKIEKKNRSFMLKEIIREAKHELDCDEGTFDDDSTDADVEMFRQKLEKLSGSIPLEVEKRIKEEIGKLRNINKQSPDYLVCQNYLSWITDLPWKEESTDTLDVEAARKILDRDHYGLDKVKKRIIEFIGVSKLKGKVGGSILCLVGPPGVGKTSLGHSIAEALGRRFFRFSLGGMRDEAEIKGHRRTYVSALPGKVISALKVCGTRNPVIMLDEIDKLGVSVQGDPASALLEVLDPEQNSTFRDHFLDVPFDLSKVLFIATANVRDTIPAPLLDRMEIIDVQGYITEEKLAIAKKHLIPKLLPRNGLKKNNVSFTDKSLRAIIDGFARDSGVRALENSIGSCLRKIAVNIAEGKQAVDEKRVIKDTDIKELLGKPVYYDDPLVHNPKKGVAMGLAWTAVGGATLYIEALPIEGEPSLKITGQLGDVMKESTQIALSVVEKNANAFGIDKDFFKSHKLHVHVPAGATPKDGPSAGITIASAIISGAGGKTLPPCWAMTGELTLTSRVLPVGGIREKMLAARRAGVKNVILPKDNERDFTEISENARMGLVPHYVSDYGEVYKLLFTGR